jgi:hypothetical protein
MMQLVRRASLVVVILLASVGAASAECAWVLWGESTVEGKWRYLLSATSKGECDHKRNDWYDLHYGSVGRPSAPSEISRRLEVFHCVPDTIDPRGTRGK